MRFKAYSHSSGSAHMAESHKAAEHRSFPHAHGLFLGSTSVQPTHVLAISLSRDSPTLCHLLLPSPAIVSVSRSRMDQAYFVRSVESRGMTEAIHHSREYVWGLDGKSEPGSSSGILA